MSPRVELIVFTGAVLGAVLLIHAVHAPTFSNVAATADISSVTAPAATTTQSAFVNVPAAASASDVPGGLSSAAPAPVTPAPFVSTGGGALPFARVASDPVPTVDYHEALIADLDTGAIVTSENDTARWPMASITKLMNAVIVFQHLDLQQQVTVTPAMIAIDPSEKTLVAGGTYSVADLLHVMLLPSSNVAAEALADTYGRSQFLAAMNAQAAAWGMTQTYYDDPSGLSAANQLTAQDLLLLAQHVYASYPQIFTITDTPSTTITELNTGTAVPVKSINDFAGQPNFVGGKTGYTDQADGNLLSVFWYENRPVLVIVLGTSDTERFTITQTLYNWFTKDYR